MRKYLVLFILVLIPLVAVAQNLYVDNGDASIVSKSGSALKLASASTQGISIGVNGVVEETISATAHTLPTNNLVLTAGSATLGAGVRYPAALMETKAAAGANQGNSTALTAGKFIHMVTAADETTGVVLPACAAANIGEIHFVMNTVANKFLNIWPATGGNINGLGANNVFAGGATGQGRKTHICACQAANVWYCG